MHIRLSVAAALAAAARFAFASVSGSPSPAAAAPTAPKQDVTPYAYLRAPLPARAPAACSAAKASDGSLKLPLFSRQAATCPVALVEGAPIELQELTEILASEHGTRAPGKAGAKNAHDMDFTPALDRIIETRLLTSEAQSMGLGDLPEIKNAIDEFKATTLRAMIQRRATRDIRPDALEVERSYRNTVREWKVKSLLFAKEEDAAGLATDLKAGKSFDALARQAAAAKKAQGGTEDEVVGAKQALPQIRAALDPLQPGGVTSAIQVPGGWAVMKVVSVSYPDDPATKAKAQEASVKRQRNDATRRHYEQLVKRWAKVDQKLLQSIDFEAPKPGMKALEKDARVLAHVQGEKPVTVADLTRSIEDTFFHGIEGPIKEHKVNTEMHSAFEKTLGMRLFAKEAAQLKLAQSAEFKRQVEEYRRGVLFSTFVERVLVPDIKVSEPEGKAYFDQHQAEFTSPQMYKLESLGFAKADGAQSALKKLRGGTDWAFLRTNADGQLAPADRTLQLDGNVVTATGLPAEVRTVLTGAKAGEYRLYSTASQHYVIHVIDQIPPKLQAYPETREPIGKKLYQQKLAQAIRDYAAKLRKARPVEVYLQRIGV